MLVSRTTRIMNRAATGIHAAPSVLQQFRSRSPPWKVDPDRLAWRFPRTSEAIPAPDHVVTPGGRIPRPRRPVRELWPAAPPFARRAGQWSTSWNNPSFIISAAPSAYFRISEFQYTRKAAIGSIRVARRAG